MRVICSPEHPLVGKRVSKRHLANAKWVGFPAVRGRESFGRLLERLLAPIGVDEVKITLIDSLTAQKRLVQAGFGLALVPESLKELEIPAMRASIPVALIHRRNGYLNPATRALIALMSEKSLRLGERGSAD
jgi:DNA-binding transcriptional LysR family regulator